MHLLLKLAHFNLNDFAGLAGGTDHGRDWQRIDVAGQFDAASDLSRRRHCLPEGRYAFADRNSCCGIEATMEKPTSAQHSSQPKLMLPAADLFITLFLEATLRTRGLIETLLRTCYERVNEVHRGKGVSRRGRTTSPGSEAVEKRSNKVLRREQNEC